MEDPTTGHLALLRELITSTAARATDQAFYFRILHDGGEASGVERLMWGNDDLEITVTITPWQSGSTPKLLDGPTQETA